MNEKSSQTENIDGAKQEVSALSKPQSAEDKSTSSGISITQLTLAALVIVFLWQWFESHRIINDMQQQLARKIAEMDGNSKANQILLAQSQEQVRQLFAKVTTLEGHFAESQNQRASLEALYNELSVNRDEASLAEVEQMLQTASQQLALSANVKAALIALQSADARLQSMNRPSFNGLRKVIGQDMGKLRALPYVDITGINLQLNDLLIVIDQMPLAYQQRLEKEAATQKEAPPNEETSAQKILREIWQEVRQLVRIENTGKTEIPLLPPSQEFFLRENLRLHLISARLALLSRDEGSFKLALKSAQNWTARYFDGKSEVVKQMSEGLKKLAGSDISIQLPDINPSVQAVRNYRLTREREPKTGLEVRPKEQKAIRNGQSRAVK